MAMYYQGSSSEIQAADGLHHTLYLLNPNYVAYSDTPQQPTTHFLNSASVLPHAPPSPLPQFTGIPLSHYTIYNGLVDQTTNQNQPPPGGLSLSLAAHDQSGFDTCRDPIDQLGQSSIAIISPKNCSSPSLTTESNGADATRISAVVGSKYLKAAQELLDDVANVGKDVKRENKAKTIKDSVVAAKITNTEGENGGGHELTTAQRQEIQMKKAKLNSMLDEVEQRCRQYHHQMQIVVASFEQAAGPSSAKSYTQLALKTILKQFRCLKSTISAQIKALSKSLGEEETTDKKFEGSRLKFVDHQLRQHRALQQLGMVQNNNAWRPQRGLPERAVSVLRAWLFEHFLHPYPKDSDKQMLAKQTGLTRSQVSNWFINARVRLWKPMVEEMYLEEIKSNNQEQISSNNNSIKNGQQNQNHNKTAKIDTSPTDISPSTVVSASPTGSQLQSRAGFAQLITSLNLPENSPKKPRTHDSSPSSILSAEMEMKGAGERSKGLNNYLSSMNRYGVGEFSPGQHQQQLAATGSFPGNSFSLSLALPPTETSQGAHQQNFLSHQFGMRIESGNVESTSHPSIGYEILDFQSRKPFPAQLLPDFVA